MPRKLYLLFVAMFVLAGCTPPTTKTEAVNGGGGTATPSVDVGDLTKPQPTIAYVRKTYGDTVLFDYDSAVVRPDAEAVIHGWAMWMVAFPKVTVVIEGHCDERGTREYNLALGDRRANAIRNVLIAYGIDGSRIGTLSYGKERPAVEGHTEDAWARNRRGVLTLSS